MMATRESLAIRTEKAQARIASATEKLKAQTGQAIPAIAPTAKDPIERQTELVEQVASLLESMVVIDDDGDGEPVEGDDEPPFDRGRILSEEEQEAVNQVQAERAQERIQREAVGDGRIDNQGASSRSLTQQIKKPIKRGPPSSRRR